MLFSIIVPIYNVEKYIRQCVDSILNQTFADFELILVDDGSIDNSGKICDEYAAKDLRIKVIHKQNGGVVSARKTGVEAAKGEYCVTVDSDDYISSQQLERIAGVIVEHRPDVVSFNAVRFDENGPFGEVPNHISSGLYDEKEIIKIRDCVIYDKNKDSLNLGCMPFALWSKAIKTPLLKKSQNMVPDNVKMGEDLAVIAPIICECKSIYILSENLYFYRDNPTSIVNTFDEKEIERYEILFNHLTENATKIPYNNILVYVLLMTSNYFVKAIRFYDSYSDCKKIFKKYQLSRLLEKIKKAKVYRKNFNDRIKIFLLVHKLYYLLWLRYKKR